MRSKRTKKIPLRLAFRAEGDFWNCYMAQRDTMDGAKLIGSIGLGAVKQNHEVKRLFMDLMKMIFADAAEHVTGTRPELWSEDSAPESERSGNA